MKLVTILSGLGAVGAAILAGISIGGVLMSILTSFITVIFIFSAGILTAVCLLSLYSDNVMWVPLLSGCGAVGAAVVGGVFLGGSLMSVLIAIRSAIFIFGAGALIVVCMLYSGDSENTKV
jgi:hypothetical protein